jgi:capsid protein
MNQETLLETFNDFIESGGAQKVFEEFMDEQVASGRVKVPGYFENPEVRKAYLNVKWEKVEA